jgi:hypothetical protein
MYGARHWAATALESIMYALITTQDNIKAQWFFARTKKLFVSIQNEAVDWRLHDGNCWCESKHSNSYHNMAFYGAALDRAEGTFIQF